MTTCKGPLLCSVKGTSLELDRDRIRGTILPTGREQCGVGGEKKRGRSTFFNKFLSLAAEIVIPFSSVGT